MKKYKFYILSFIISFLICLIFILPTLIENNGLFFINGDFYLQQIPFQIDINNTIKNGFRLFTFGNDLGSELISSYSFYNLGSLFNIFSLLFSSNFYQYLIGPLLVSKFAFCGLFSFIYFKSNLKKEKNALIAALLYTFSGFQISSLYFYHFHDVVILFPLLLYSLDQLVINKKNGFFLFMVALSSLTNYIFLFGEIIFILIYLLVNFVTKRYKINYKIILKIIFELILGILISLPILWSSLHSLFGNPRISSTVSNNLFIYPFYRYLDILKSFVMPPSIVADISLTVGRNLSSCEVYLPLFGFIFIIPYLIKNYKNWISIIIYIIFIFMFIPILNSSFFLFNSEYYARWFYMSTLFFSLATVRYIEEKNSIKFAYIIYSLFLIVILILFYIYNNFSKLHINNYFIISVIISVISAIILYFILNNYYKNDKVKILIIFIIIVSILMGLNYIKYCNNTDLSRIKQYLNSQNYKNIIDDNTFYRVKFENCDSNINLLFNLPSIESFNSTIHSSLFKFYNSIGLNRKQITLYPNTYYSLLDQLGVKYIITCNNYNSEMKNTEFLYSIDNYSVYYNNDYISIPRTYNQYISIEDYNNLDNKDRINSYSNYLILNDEQIDKYKDIIMNGTVDNYTAQLVNNKIETDVYMNEENLLVFYIPYDNNFKIYINGLETNIEEINNGFIGVLVKKGQNNIKIIYDDKEFKIGLIISIVTIFISILYIKKIDKTNYKKIKCN